MAKGFKVEMVFFFFFLLWGWGGGGRAPGGFLYAALDVLELRLA